LLLNTWTRLPLDDPFCDTPFNFFRLRRYNGIAWSPGRYKVWIFIGLLCALFLIASVVSGLFPELPLKTRVQLDRQRALYEIVIKEQEQVH